jgi:hypothetical protein
VGVVLGMERTEKIGGPGYFALFEKSRGSSGPGQVTIRGVPEARSLP